mmetsp:Transcript_14207/g.25138  ORF Transcript_14207/g.25138 Transcript_14207/m.25138 type:complete len:104 (-) Transcript_14207:363-674(-)
MISRGEKVILRVDLDEEESGSSGGSRLIGQGSKPDFSDGPISAQEAGRQEGEQRGAGRQGMEGVIALLLHSVLAAADDDDVAAPPPCSTTTPLVQEPSLQSKP